MMTIILAAGRGERLGSMTLDTPKPLIQLSGKPLIVHNIEKSVAAGIRRIGINVHYLADVIRNSLGPGARFGSEITYRFEPELLGTAGAVRNFLDLIGDESVVVVYGDNLSDIELRGLIEFHREKSSDMSIALFEKDDVSQSGVADCDPNGRMSRFVEKPPPGLALGNWVNAGIYVIEPTLLREIPEGFSDFGRDWIPRWIAEGRAIYGYKSAGRVVAIDTPEMYSSAQAIVAGKSRRQ